jgi:hypothetical protein
MTEITYEGVQWIKLALDSVLRRIYTSTVHNLIQTLFE